MAITIQLVINSNPHHFKCCIILIFLNIEQVLNKYHSETYNFALEKRSSSSIVVGHVLVLDLTTWQLFYTSNSENES